MFAQYIHKHTGESSGRKIHNLISHILTERKGLSDALDALSFTGTDWHWCFMVVAENTQKFKQINDTQKIQSKKTKLCKC